MSVTLESLASEVANLRSMVEQLVVRQTGIPAVPASYERFPEGPRIVEVRPHIRMKLEAPVIPDYEPPFSALNFGRDFDQNPANGFPFTNWDPSNAGPERPCRSPEGYPLHYLPDGTTRLMNAYGDFGSVQEIEADRAYRRAQNDKSRAEWANKYNG
jgi:hypothetical protein